MLSALVALCLLGQAALAHLPQKTVWEERAKPVRPPAGVAANAKWGMPNKIIIPPSFRTPHSAFRISPDLLKFVRAKGFPDLKQQRVVYLLQDIHLNEEAQRNMAGALQILAKASDAKLLVGVEGTVGPFDFSRYRGPKHRAALNKIAQEFVQKGQIGAVSYTGLTAGDEVIRHLNATGIESPDLYGKNIEAYRKAAEHKDEIGKILELEEFKLNERASRECRAPLVAFLEKRADYHAGKTSLGDYAMDLSAHFNILEAPLHLSTFLEAYQLEQHINFDLVEKERERLMHKLTAQLTQEETSALMARTLSYKSGQIKLATYYHTIKQLLDRYQIDLKEFPHFEQYLRYILLADGVQIDQLFSDIKTFEMDVIKSLKPTEAEWAIVNQSRFLVLAKKLIQFALTPEEWGEYKEMQNSPPLVGRQRPIPLQRKRERRLAVARGGRGRGLVSSSFSHKGRGILNLAAFESFYHLAEQRNEALVSNFLRHEGTVRVLIAGGFHTPGLQKILHEKGYSTVVLTPHITKADAANGNEYLKVFLKEKSPLQKLFVGRKLFLALPEAIGTRLQPYPVPLREEAKHEVEKIISPAQGFGWAMALWVRLKSALSRKFGALKFALMVRGNSPVKTFPYTFTRKSSKALKDTSDTELKKKILIIGASGFIGEKTYQMLKKDKNLDVIGTYFKNKKKGLYHLNVRHRRLKKFLFKHKPDIIVYAAAEAIPVRASQNRENALALNAEAVQNIGIHINSFQRSGEWTKPVHFIYLSTDYVFDGMKPINEYYDTKATPNPLNWYGHSKAFGEQMTQEFFVEHNKHTIIRSGVAYGTNGHLDEKPNFVRKVFEHFIRQQPTPPKKPEPLYADPWEIKHPTLLDDIAEVVCSAIYENKYGILQINGSPGVTQFEIARLIAEILPTLTPGFNTGALLNLIKDERRRDIDRPYDTRMRNWTGSPPIHPTPFAEGLRKTLIAYLKMKGMPVNESTSSEPSTLAGIYTLFDQDVLKHITTWAPRESFVLAVFVGLLFPALFTSHLVYLLPTVLAWTWGFAHFFGMYEIVDGKPRYVEFNEAIASPEIWKSIVFKALVAWLWLSILTLFLIIGFDHLGWRYLPWQIGFVRSLALSSAVGYVAFNVHHDLNSKTLHEVSASSVPFFFGQRGKIAVITIGLILVFGLSYFGVSLPLGEAGVTIGMALFRTPNGNPDERVDQILRRFEGAIEGMPLPDETEQAQELWDLRRYVQGSTDYRNRAIQVLTRSRWNEATQAALMNVAFVFRRDISTPQVTSLLEAARDQRLTSHPAVFNLCLLVERCPRPNNQLRQVMVELLNTGHPQIDLIRSRFWRPLRLQEEHLTEEQNRMLTDAVLNDSWGTETVRDHYALLVQRRLRSARGQKSAARRQTVTAIIDRLPQANLSRQILYVWGTALLDYPFSFEDRLKLVNLWNESAFISDQREETDMHLFPALILSEFPTAHRKDVLLEILKKGKDHPSPGRLYGDLMEWPQFPPRFSGSSAIHYLRHDADEADIDTLWSYLFIDATDSIPSFSEGSVEERLRGLWKRAREWELDSIGEEGVGAIDPRAAIEILVSLANEALESIAAARWLATIDLITLPHRLAQDLHARLRLMQKMTEVIREGTIPHLRRFAENDPPNLTQADILAIAQSFSRTSLAGTQQIELALALVELRAQWSPRLIQILLEGMRDGHITDPLAKDILLSCFGHLGGEPVSTLLEQIQELQRMVVGQTRARRGRAAQADPSPPDALALGRRPPSGSWAPPEPVSERARVEDHFVRWAHPYLELREGALRDQFQGFINRYSIEGPWLDSFVVSDEATPSVQKFYFVVQNRHDRLFTVYRVVDSHAVANSLDMAFQWARESAGGLMQVSDYHVDRAPVADLEQFRQIVSRLNIVSHTRPREGGFRGFGRQPTRTRENSRGPESAEESAVRVENHFQDWSRDYPSLQALGRGYFLRMASAHPESRLLDSFVLRSPSGEQGFYFTLHSDQGLLYIYWIAMPGNIRNVLGSRVRWNRVIATSPLQLQAHVADLSHEPQERERLLSGMELISITRPQQGSVLPPLPQTLAPTANAPEENENSVARVERHMREWIIDHISPRLSPEPIVQFLLHQTLNRTQGLLLGSFVVGSPTIQAFYFIVQTEERRLLYRTCSPHYSPNTLDYRLSWNPPLIHAPTGIHFHVADLPEPSDELFRGVELVSITQPRGGTVFPLRPVTDTWADTMTNWRVWMARHGLQITAQDERELSELQGHYNVSSLVEDGPRGSVFHFFSHENPSPTLYVTVTRYQTAPGVLTDFDESLQHIGNFSEIQREVRPPRVYYKMLPRPTVIHLWEHFFPDVSNPFHDPRPLSLISSLVHVRPDGTISEEDATVRGPLLENLLHGMAYVFLISLIIGAQVILIWMYGLPFNAPVLSAILLTATTATPVLTYGLSRIFPFLHDKAVRRRLNEKGEIVYYVDTITAEDRRHIFKSSLLFNFLPAQVFTLLFGVGTHFSNELTILVTLFGSMPVFWALASGILGGAFVFMVGVGFALHQKWNLGNSISLTPKMGLNQVGEYLFNAHQTPANRTNGQEKYPPTLNEQFGLLRKKILLQQRAV